MSTAATMFSYNFHKERSAAIDSLRKRLGEFDAVVPFDVTLCCAENPDSMNFASFQAHGFLLSASSAILRDMIIKAASCQDDSTIIVIIGVYEQDMKSILTYIYEGEVSVPANYVDSFRSAAECLKIKGICADAESGALIDSQSQPYVCKFLDPTNRYVSAKTPLQAPLHSTGPNRNMDLPHPKKEKTVHVKSEKQSKTSKEPKQTSTPKQPKPKLSKPKESPKESQPNNDEQNLQIQKTEEGGGLCLVCGTPFSIFGNCKSHYVKKHGEEIPGAKNYNCLICESDPEKVSASRFNFQVNFKEHLKLQHKVKGNLKRVAEEGNDYWILRDDNGGGYCLKCNTYFTIFGNLKAHFNKKHSSNE